jgi:oligopeptide transport system ATP-binding protein
LIPPREYHIAVKDLNLTLKKGEILGIVGESGSGKSSLAKALLRLIDPVMGEIKLFDADWLDLQGRELRLERKRMQLIFQDPFASLNPKMKIGEAILEPMLEHKIYPPAEAHQKTLELLQKVGLQVGDFNKYPSQFSGGQRQRISIARALALNPEVLVCDESVSALDVTVQAQVLQLLLDIQRERDLSIIFISHDMAVVYNICDRIVVMKSGEIVEEGDVEHIFFNAVHPYTQNLLDAVPKIPKHNA